MSAAGGSGRFADLRLRIASAAGMIVLAALAVWLGGAVYRIALLAVVGLAVWELFRICQGQGDRLLPRLAAGAALLGLAGLMLLPGPIGWGLAALGLCAPVVMLRRMRGLYVIYALLIGVAFHVFLGLREAGAMPLVWFITTVAVTDIGGYFGGRLIGGPKLWRAVSPGKTWSGTVSGWVAAVAVGFAFMGAVDVNPDVLLRFAFFVAVFSQAGDLLESWIKRRAGVKDSSQIIPGHGGVLDRFDGMIGGAIGLLLIEWKSGTFLLPVVGN